MTSRRLRSTCFSFWGVTGQPFSLVHHSSCSPSVISAVWGSGDCRGPVLLAGHGFSCLDAFGALVGRQLCTLAMGRNVDISETPIINHSSLFHHWSPTNLLKPGGSRITTSTVLRPLACCRRPAPWGPLLCVALRVPEPLPVPAPVQQPLALGCWPCAALRRWDGSPAWHAAWAARRAGLRIDSFSWHCSSEVQDWSERCCTGPASILGLRSCQAILGRWVDLRGLRIYLQWVPWCSTGHNHSFTVHL